MLFEGVAMDDTTPLVMNESAIAPRDGVASPYVELQRDYKMALAEIAALRAERARLSARLAHANAEVSALRAARDAAASDTSSTRCTGI
jgi:hypothetical protein